ncbi:MAG: hypothetical protein J2P26_09075, partial [Nocardiopsaceae bacterium]|nr:hypothetical protein [Nocardiopsaceae bacterium]
MGPGGPVVRDRGVRRPVGVPVPVRLRRPAHDDRIAEVADLGGQGGEISVVPARRDIGHAHRRLQLQHDLRAVP